MSAGLPDRGPGDHGQRPPARLLRTDMGAPSVDGAPMCSRTATYCRATLTPPEKAESCSSIAAGVVPAGTSKTTLLLNEVFSPAIRTQLKGAVGAAGQGWSGSSGTSVSAPRRRLLTGGTRPSLAQGLDLQRCFPDASSEGESW